MGKIITFNVTCLGASHIKSNKPCQDYSLSWHSDDNTIQVSIVCDGHGGDTYVRSDRGSRLAAEISLSNIREAVKGISPKLFLDKEGAVTARPEEEDDIFHSVKKPAKPSFNYSENDDEGMYQQQEKQKNDFYASVQSIREQDQFMQRLFARIYMQWMEAITQDAANDPFTEWEKSRLNGARLAKAYGTTLMAFVRTPLYWFAFHIGDGKLLCCDANLKWSEPVPWDCNCFLNLTTSLCASEPLHSFRYAFNGKGEFPAAVIMGSDGLDDSWCTKENLQNFYSQVLAIFDDLKADETVKQLKDYLPHLSEKGSRDDMSMAGIIDMEAIVNGVAAHRKKRELNLLKKEKKEKEDEIAKIQQQVDTANSNNLSLQKIYEEEKKKEEAWLVRLNLQRSEIEMAEKKLRLSYEQKSEAEQSLSEAKMKFNDWLQDASKKKVQLESDYWNLLTVDNEVVMEVAENWKSNREKFLEEQEHEIMQNLSKKVAYMKECEEEAVKGIREAKFEPEVSDYDCKEMGILEEFIETEESPEAEAEVGQTETKVAVADTDAAQAEAEVAVADAAQTDAMAEESAEAIAGSAESTEKSAEKATAEASEKAEESAKAESAEKSAKAEKSAEKSAEDAKATAEASEKATAEAESAEKSAEASEKATEAKATESAQATETTDTTEEDSFFAAFSDVKPEIQTGSAEAEEWKF